MNENINKKQDIDANAINLVHKNTPTVFKNYVRFEQTPSSTVEVLTDESIVSKGYVDDLVAGSFVDTTNIVYKNVLTTINGAFNFL